MLSDVSLKCKCGLFKGLVRGVNNDRAVRFVCMCEDCQAYARFLNRSSDVLDKNGGTDILPIYPADMKITDGFENLRCMRLSEKGLFRWYAGCCNTPIGNTQSSALPYIGMVHSIFESNNLDETLGPIRARVMAKNGKPPLPLGSHQTMPLSILFSIGGFLLRGLLRGKGQPHPFFSGNKKIEALVLSPDERTKLRQTS